MSKTRPAVAATVLTAAVILGAVLAVGWSLFPRGDKNLDAETAQAPTGEIVRAEEPIVGVRENDATPNQNEDRRVAGDAAPSSVALHSLFGDLDYSSPSYLDAQDRAGVMLGNFQDQPLRAEILKVDFDAAVAAYQSARDRSGGLNPPLQVSLFGVVCTISSARAYETLSSIWSLSSSCDEIPNSSIAVTIHRDSQRVTVIASINGAAINVGVLTPGYALAYELPPQSPPDLD